MRQLRAWVIGLALLACIDQTHAVDATLGQQDFSNGTFTDLTAFNNASVGEPAPFNGFRGDDNVSSNPFTGSFTFTYSPGVFTSGSITIGMYDHDSAAAGPQVQSFTVDGNDLTALLNSAFDGSGGNQVEYNTYTIALPAGAMPALSDGSATFSLTLQPPGLLDGPTASIGNGAGLDFATLSLVPEPGGFTALCLAAALALRRRVTPADQPVIPRAAGRSQRENQAETRPPISDRPK